LQQLLLDPRLAGLKFKKLKGYEKTSIYTIYVTGNYKISMEIKGDEAIPQHVAEHNEIDRAP
jgi:plasmid maintenance system killer protein